MTVSTQFDIASLTKLFTTTAVLRLVTGGALRLDSTLTDLLPLDAFLRQRLQGIDLTRLLTHFSGLPWWYPFYTRRAEPWLSILADLLRAPALRASGEEAVYSDLNFMILGVVLERTLGVDLPRCMDDLVLRPLGLDHSSFGRPKGPAAATETGNRIEHRMVAELGASFDGWRDEGRPIVGEPNDGNCFYYFGGAAGHAGLFSDARDLCRLGRLYLEGGRFGGVPWLGPGLAEEALRAHAGGRGLGFQLAGVYPRGTLGHTGFTGTCLMLDPSNGVAAALLTNRLHVPEPRDIDPYRGELLEAIVAAAGEDGPTAGPAPDFLAPPSRPL